MITIIAKRIDNGDPDGGQMVYARDLIGYMAAPETKEAPAGAAEGERNEKCVAIMGRGFSTPDPTPEEMAAEMAADCTLSRQLKDGQGVDHWVLSWKDTDGPGPDATQMMEAVNDWIAAMGYGVGHKWTAAIHADTAHTHAHVALCRVNALTAKVKPRGWWKRDNQRALAEIAAKHGWQPEGGAKYKAPRNTRPETVETQDPITGRTTRRTRPAVTAADPAREGEAAYSPGDKAARHERYSGTWSHKRILRERLAAAYADIGPRLGAMKWGQIHAALAERGIEMDRRTHGERHGLVYSLDGQHWMAASDVCPDMSWRALDGHIGAKPGSWRAAGEGVREALAAARARIDATVPTAKAAKEAGQMLSKAEIQGLRDLPPDVVRDALRGEGVKLSSRPKDVRNGLDVAIKEAGIPYADAVRRLAEIFPDAIRAGRDGGAAASYADAVAAARAEATAAGKPMPEYAPGEFGHEAGVELVQWWRALQLDRIDIHTAVSPGARGPVWGHNRKGMSLSDTLRAMPSLLAVAAKGTAGDAPTTIYCAPHWREDRVGIMVDDVRDPDFLRRNPPNAVIATSDGPPQAFWILDRKYPEREFYDDFTANLNRLYGDPKILRQGHDTRVAGFHNKKRPQGDRPLPRVHVRESSTRRPVEMERLVESYRREWEARRDRDRQIQDRRRQQLEAVGRDLVRQARAEADELAARLRRVPVPDWIKDAGLRARDYLIAKDGLGDRSRIDARVARILYNSGAAPDQVYSYLIAHMVQDDTPVERRHKDGTLYTEAKVQGPAGKDRQARRITANMAPPSISPDGWAARNPERAEAVDQAYQHLAARRAAEDKARAETRRQAAEGTSPAESYQRQTAEGGPRQ